MTDPYFTKEVKRKFANAFDFSCGMGLKELAKESHEGDVSKVEDDIRWVLNRPQAFRAYIARYCT